MPKLSPTIQIPDDLETVEVLAADFKVSDRTIRRWVAEGRIVGYRFGPKFLRISRGEIAAQFRPVA